MIAFDAVVHGSAFVGCLEVDVHPAHQSEDVADVPIPLTQRLAVDLGEIAVVLSRLRRPRDQVRNDPPQVRHAELAGPHGVVPHVLGLRVRVAHAETALRQVLVHAVMGALDDPLVEDVTLVLGRCRLRKEAVSPIHGMVIVYADATQEVLWS